MVFPVDELWYFCPSIVGVVGYGSKAYRNIEATATEAFIYATVYVTSGTPTQTKGAWHSHAGHLIKLQGCKPS